MGKLVNAIIGVALVAVGTLTGQPQIVALGTSMIVSTAVSLLFGPKSAKPQQSEQQISDPTAPRVYGYGTRRVYGNRAFWGNSSDGGTVDAISFVDGKAHAVRKTYLNDKEVTVSGGIVQMASDGAYAGSVVRAGYNLGATPETAFPAVMAALPGIWTADHRGDGVVSGYLIKQPVKDKNFLDTYPQGDNVSLSLVIDLQLCFDPRKPGHDIDDESTWEWTENPVLHLLHYFIVRRGYSYEARILPQIAKWIAAADVCDENVPLAAGGTEKRYRACILYDSQAKPHEVIASILETFDGWYCVNERNEVVVYAGSYYEPTVTIGPEHIVDYSHQANVLDEDFYNELTIKYFSAEHDYNQPECKPWRDDASISARGWVNSTSIDPQVPSFTQGRRLAKSLMSRTNASDRGQITTNYSGRVALGQRFINVNVAEAGTVLYAGPAEISAVTRNTDTGGVTFDWIKVSPNAWAWNPATEDGYGAPIGEFPVLDPLDAPTISSATADFAAGYARIAIVGAGPDRDDLTWYARTRISGETAWFEAEYTDTDPGSPVALITGPVASNTDIEVEIAYSTGDGRVSPWSATETVDTTAP